jgi:O-antigen biosynthesis protein
MMVGNKRTVAGATATSRSLLYAATHALYHLVVPRKVRLAVWDFQWQRRMRITKRARAPKSHGHPKALLDVYIFAMVPYHDIGGGQRSAQLAKTFNKMGCAVHYVYAYESTDAGVRDAYIPAVRHVNFKDFSPRDVVASVRGAPVFIFEAPYKGYEPYLELAPMLHARVIYEHIDNWETSLGSLFFDADAFERFLLWADVIVATTQLLRKRIMAYMRTDPALADRAGDVEYVPNAVDTDLFYPDLPHKTPEDLITGAPTLLYYGSLWGEWFDWDLLRRLAEECPKAAINLIGDHKPIIARARSMPANVHFLGPKQQSELLAYLSHADFALLPFKNDEIGKYVSPLKVFEYIAMNKPVLTTALPDIAGYPNLYASDSAEDWIAVVRGNEAGSGASRVNAKEGQAFAQANNWYARCNRLLDLIEEAPDEEVLIADKRPAISIIVLNHNNRSVIGRSIDSLFEFQGRYGYQIIVVDNQSTDGSYEWLRERYGERICLVRNGRNGCASGRNLGIAHAHGDLILFVDSDQWAISARWLDAPLSILQQHRWVGAVGWGGGWFDPKSLGGLATFALPHGGITPATMFRTDIGYLGTGGFLVRREALTEAESFDETYDPTCFEDTDLSLQIRDRGFELAYCPYMNLHHVPHQTTRSGSEGHAQLMQRNGAYFLTKWQARNPTLIAGRKATHKAGQRAKHLWRRLAWSRLPVRRTHAQGHV